MSLNSSQLPSVGVVILTLNAKKHLLHCLTPLLTSPLKPRVLVVDSSSTDGTTDIAAGMGAEVLVIDRADFNHGETRELARKHLNTDVIVMVTHDAYAIDNQVLSKLVQPIVDGVAAASYARQIPHEGAGFFEAFPRDFNYPATSQIRSIDDVDKYGVYTFFCSDSFAAYSNRALDEIGGFPMVLLGEDTVVVAKLLRKHYKVAYVAEAVVRHSHDYRLLEEFRRYFDTGLARKEYGHLLECNQTDSGRGGDFVRSIMKRLIREKPYLIPYAFIQTLFKWLGYRLGSCCQCAPLWIKKICSSQKFYWTSNAFLRKEQ